MFTKFGSLAVKTKIKLDETYCLFSNGLERHTDKIMIIGSILLIANAYPNLALAQGDIDSAPIERVIQILLNDLIAGSFGALVMVIAGLVALIAAAMGAYRAAMSVLVVAIGAYILRSFVTAFWPNVDLGE